MRRKILSCIQLFVISLLVGCGSLHHTMTGQGRLLSSISKFDNATILEVTPSAIKPLDSGFYSMNTLIGATWSSKKPDNIQLNLKYSSSTGGDAYTSFKSVEFNLDGETKKFMVGGTTNFESSEYNSVTRTIYTESTNFVAIPYPYFEQILNAKSVLVRVTTSDGVESGDLSIETDNYGVHFALDGFRKLQKEIEKTR